MVRDQAGDALPAFRSHLRNELFRPGITDAEVTGAVRDLRDGATALDAKLRGLRLGRRKAAATALTAGIFGLVVYGFGIRDASLIAGGAAGLAGLLAEAHGARREHLEEVQRPPYVLLAARDAVRHRVGHKPA
jgi:hypothetical protein